ncbi:uncharacterized protein LOC129769571 [Toxorhynchites rutilus septentrionalis]|uniref:uncharacterized protein LOC129769571 n=1 Tax=Toxorhynchites rutilus septentrionalis TaxID=329112 RepID=UPI002479C5CF|nr:uncharacterized protein LOC129769571 [Toxorhynchites rutilus septentrionalis]
MSFKWNDGHMIPFLRAYRRQECLWNNKMSGYTKPILREKGYSLMVEELNLPHLTVADIKAKIKGVRTRYVAELTKVRSSENTDDVYEPRLFWFKEANAFLRNVSISKSYSSKIPDSPNACTNTIDFRQGIKEEPILPAENGQFYPANFRKSYLNDTDEQVLMPRKRPAPPMIHFPKKVKDTSNDQKGLQNEFDVFCDSLAIQLKKMPLSRALICQEKLQQVMTQERLSQLANTSNRPSSCSSPASFFSQESLPPSHYNNYSNETTNDHVEYAENDDNDFSHAVNSIELVYSDDSNQ